MHLQVLCLALLPLAACRSVLQTRAQVPSMDPFYQPPAGYESKHPGTVLRERRILSSLFGLIPDPVEAHQLLYRTTATNGSAIATVTTIFKPLFAKRDRFIAFNTAYDSSATICNPSYNYQLGALQTDLVSSVEYLVIQAYLLSGYVVAASDYEGPDAAFTAGHLSGMGILDGMRAVVNAGSKFGLSSNPSIVGVGYSGGGFATGWAASLHPTYAPDLHIKGWAMGGVPANLTGTWLNVENTLYSGFLPSAIAGLLKPSAYREQLWPLVNSILTPEGRKAVEIGGSQCVATNILLFLNKSVLDKKFQSLGPDLIYSPALVSVLEKLTMGTHQSETPTAPVFLYHATADEIIPYSNVTTLNKNWCSKGAAVTFTTYAAGGHGTTEVIGLPDVLNFVSKAFSGSVVQDCVSRTELTDKLNPIALGVNLEPLVAALGAALLKLGRKDANLKKDISILSSPVI